MENIRVLIVCFCLIAMATTKTANLKRRLAIVESNLDTLELKTDLASDNIDENSRMLAELNVTVKELGKCFVSEHDAPKETTETGRNTLKDTASHDRQSRAVLSAFEKEKSFVRKAISDFEEERILLNQTVASESKALWTEIKALALAEERHRTEMNEALSLAEERHRTEMNEALSLAEERHRTEMNEDLSLAEERHRTEMNKALSLAEERHRTHMNNALMLTDERQMHELEVLKKAHQAEISNLKAWVNETFFHTTHKAGLVQTTHKAGLVQTTHKAGLVQTTHKAGLVQTCLQTWTEYETFCYKFYDTRTSYEEARQECSSHGAYVVDIQDKEELDFVRSLKGSSGRRPFWIGMKLQDSDGTWVWERTRKKPIYTNWGPNEPSGRGSCAIEYSADGKWYMYDWTCARSSYSLSTVCKMEERKMN